MKPEKFLYIIYSIDQTKEMSRFVSYVYTLKGMIDLSDIMDSIENPDITIVADKLGPFDTEESLTRFAYSLSEKFKFSNVCLCNSEAVNRAIVECSNVTEINEKLLETGEKLENPDLNKRGFLSGLLN